jgi:hypothetical protein
MRGFVVLEDILLFFVGSAAADTDLALGPLLDQLLGLALGTYDPADVVRLGVIHGTLCQIDLLVLLQRLVVVRGHKGRTHLHAILDQPNPLPMQGISFTDFACVDSPAILVVDGFRTG